MQPQHFFFVLSFVNVSIILKSKSNVVYFGRNISVSFVLSPNYFDPSKNLILIFMLPIAVLKTALFNSGYDQVESQY